MVPEPSAEAEPATSEPPVMATEAMELAPESVSEPAPDLVRPEAAVSAPERVPDPVRSPPESVTSLARVWPPRSSAPPLTMTAPDPKAPEEPARSVPAETVVSPS